MKKYKRPLCWYSAGGIVFVSLIALVMMFEIWSGIDYYQTFNRPLNYVDVVTIQGFAVIAAACIAMAIATALVLRKDYRKKCEELGKCVTFLKEKGVYGDLDFVVEEASRLEQLSKKD